MRLRLAIIVVAICFGACSCSPARAPSRAADSAAAAQGLGRLAAAESVWVAEAPPCVVSAHADSVGWQRMGPRRLPIPPGFVQDTGRHPGVHGGVRWRRGAQVLDAATGHWGVSSFWHDSTQRRCRMAMAGRPALVLTRVDSSGLQMIAWPDDASPYMSSIFVAESPHPADSVVFWAWYEALARWH